MFRKIKPSASMVVAVIALVIALGGVSAAATGLINGATIKPGTVGHRQLARHSVSAANLTRHAIALTNLTRALQSQISRRNRVTLPSQSGSSGTSGAQGSAGAAGNNGHDGANGRDGANPAIPVINVPAITPGSKNNGNADSGPSGDGGFYFSGNGSGGSATIANGALVLNGAGADSATNQGGIGIAHAYSNVPLSRLSALVYSWFNTVNAGTQAPAIHITVTGATTDSKFGSGFANIVYLPLLSDGLTTSPVLGSLFTQDTFSPGAQWYSTGAGCHNASCTPFSNQGGINNPKPLSYFVTNDPNAVITQISLDNGGSSGTPAGSYQGEADNLLVGFNNNNTRYDFGG